ncbi:MAG TPA: YceI family protein [Verrucomicrobiae bacterium]
MKNLTNGNENLRGAWPLALALACGLAIQATAQSIRYDSQPGGAKVKIEGTSSIHDWKMEGPVIGGFIEAAAGFPEAALKGGDAAKPKVEVFIPVRSLKSYNPKMDEVYQEHMEAAKFKNMEYKLTELKAKGSAPKDGKCEFDAIGTMTIHGVAKEITMPVTIEKTEVEKDGKKSPQLKITGETPLKISDFGVKPPNPKIPGMGEITTGDDIKMTFEWLPKQK